MVNSRIVSQRLKSTSRAMVAMVAMLQLSGIGLAQDAPQHLDNHATLGAGMYNMQVEVALTPQEHAIGLMNRSSMGANEGMLFVFERAGVQCFWMKNTLIPLAVAFVTDDGTVVNLDEMKPQTLDSHCSAQPVRYVLEMNAGWFKKKGVKPGQKLSGAPFGTPR
jgi:uncharacterized membrane protein (UPF0127 family)